MARPPAPAFAFYAGLVSFETYSAMYAFRKPLAAASFAGVWPLGAVEYKTELVMAQVVGYAIAKLIGVKVIAELAPRRRALGIVAQVALAEAALVGFALVPSPWNIACLFADGPTFGMVFGFIEGRRQSDLIDAMLCASFILSSGVAKSVGEALMLRGISCPFWMPAATGLLFAPLLGLSVLDLSLLPAPSAADVAEGTGRAPMNAAARCALVRRYAPGLAALVVIYVALTALRDHRDNFAAEPGPNSAMAAAPTCSRFPRCRSASWCWACSPR